MRRRKSRFRHAPTIVILALIPMSGALWLVSNRAHGPAQRAVDCVLSPLDASGSSTARSVSDLLAAARRMLRSGAEVRQLEEEAAQLRAQVASLEDRLRQKAHAEDALRKFITRDRKTTPNAQYLTHSQIIEAKGIMAWPIAADASSYRYSLLIDRGDGDGVVPGAAVTSGGALVGQVRSVRKQSSRVLLICDPSSRVPVRFLDASTRGKPFRIQPSDRSPAQGLLCGVRPGLYQVRYVPRDAEVQVGDSVVTSGLDGRFPSGLPVGKVTRTKRRELFLDLDLSPYTPIHALRALIVLQPALEAESSEQEGDSLVAEN